MTVQGSIEERLSRPQTRTALRGMRLLVGAYFAISVLTLAVVAVLHADAAVVTTAVWVRGGIVVGSALLMNVFAFGTARGSRKAFLRLRMVSAVMVVAIVVIVAIPGLFPLWMRFEQAGCGLVLLGVVAIVNGRRLRSSFAA